MLEGPAPIVIAHRGASGYRPEHTLEAYRLAIQQGADYVEPDLVATRDGVLVARHENEMGDTTNVADHPEFADRRTTKLIDGAPVVGWFTEDFALAELRTLRARERLRELRPANTSWDGQLGIPTFTEVIELVVSEAARLGRRVGLYPETKHPARFRSLGLPLEEPLAHALDAATDVPVYVQSFESDSLHRVAGLTRMPLVQLLGARAGSLSPARLGEIAAYASAIGPDKELVMRSRPRGHAARPTRLIGDAHDAGLAVHAWTFWAEQVDDPLAEYGRFFEAGLDGVFADQPDLAITARSRFLER